MFDIAHEFGIYAQATDHVELAVSDLSLARAYFDGVPAARILARTRLARDERDLHDPDDALLAPRVTYDLLVQKVVPDPKRREELARAVARHTRAASDEGPLLASDSVVITLVRAASSVTDPDASLSEIVAADAGGVSPPELSSSAAFEACVHLAATDRIGPWPLDRLNVVLSQLDLALGVSAAIAPLPAPLYPRDIDPKASPNVQRLGLVDRAPLDTLVSRDPRDLAAAIARKSGSGRASIPPPSAMARAAPSVDAFLADLTRVLRHAGVLVLAVVPSRDLAPDDTGAFRPPRSPSWLPQNWSNPASVIALAEALEHGATTVPRIRLVVAHGGEEALEAVGSEMLRVEAHPFASAAFAEVLASSGRPRDVMRLVTYFALAPDPGQAAHALSVCRAPELPRLLSAWLESMLPSDGEPAVRGDDPDRSSGARLTACIHALEPYPHLHAAVAPLLRRVSDAAPPGSS